MNTKPTSEDLAATAADPVAAEPQPVTLAGANADVAEDIGKSWTKVLIVCAGPIKKDEKRVVIVSERSSDPKFDEAGEVIEHAEIKMDGYPAGGDVYFRSTPLTEFPKSAEEILTWGQNIGIGGSGGFSIVPGLVHTGPAMPVYSAINYAILRGAEQIEVDGLTDWEKSRLQPFIDQAFIKAEAVKRPLSVKIILS